MTIQVLVQAREHLIKKTFEAIRGAKHVIFHFYNSTSTLQREVVFRTDVAGVKQIAIDAADLIYQMAQPVIAEGMDLRFEYSPESFMGTEMDAAVEICEAVLDHLHADEQHKVILNLPTTVENCMPNQFADELEYFIRKLPGRERAIISLHPHNDRGCGVATTEAGLLAGAERVEACLFGNGERTGNVDLVTVAMNMYVQGIDPELDFSHMDRIREMYERCTKMQVPERQPYAGDLVFTAFSGCHQDAINKGFNYMEETGTDTWDGALPAHRPRRSWAGSTSRSSASIPSPARAARPSSCNHKFGFDLPKAMHGRVRRGGAGGERPGRQGAEGRPHHGAVRTGVSEGGRPLQADQARLPRGDGGRRTARLPSSGTIQHKDTVFSVNGEGNGPIDAFFNAIHGQKMDKLTFVDYKSHAITKGSDSVAVAYIQLRDDETGEDIFGIGVSHNINLAPLRGILCAINRYQRKKEAAKAE